MNGQHLEREKGIKRSMKNCRNLPQIFNGASSSSRMGCCRNISLDFKQSPRTSASVIWTDFPGRHPLTYRKLYGLLSNELNE